MRIARTSKNMKSAYERVRDAFPLMAVGSEVFNDIEKRYEAIQQDAKEGTPFGVFFLSLDGTEQTEVLEAAIFALTGNDGREHLDLSDVYAGELVAKIREVMNKE